MHTHKKKSGLTAKVENPNEYSSSAAKYCNSPAVFKLMFVHAEAKVSVFGKPPDCCLGPIHRQVGCGALLKRIVFTVTQCGLFALGNQMDKKKRGEKYFAWIHDLE